MRSELSPRLTLGRGCSKLPLPMLSTATKMRIARILYRVVHGMRRPFGGGDRVRVGRRGVTWDLDLREGIDLTIYALGAFEIPTLRVLESVVKRRERNPRNRVLCIRLKGERCAGCGLEPRKSYGSAGAIIEVHHLEPLSLLQAPRPYDPAFDLVPLCPNCHRAVHTRRPVPLSLAELTATREAARE